MADFSRLLVSAFGFCAILLIFCIISLVYAKRGKRVWRLIFGVGFVFQLIAVFGSFSASVTPAAIAGGVLSLIIIVVFLVLDIKSFEASDQSPLATKTKSLGGRGKRR